MTNQNLSFLVDENIAAHSYYEGMLIHPTNPINGMAVMRSNASDLTLDIYKITLHDETTYHIERHLLNKAFKSENDVQAFLHTFSTLRESEFNAFIEANY
ncbi:hypothetical protein [Paraliobacillus zengyii]|uniref:hypothetical protein n=1 Tax=Paraliobacillus zengyii TaxID=2213194 RepID=UPI000E3DE629|nr:hypothetical protein [Paraliobacillus zengyii]